MINLKEKYRNNKAVILTVLIILIFTAGLYSLKIMAQGPGGGPASGGQADSEDSSEAVAVEVSESYRGDFSDYERVTAKAEAAEEVRLTARVQEEVEDVKVKVGEEVEKNDILVELNKRSIDLDILQAESSLASARANLQSTIDGAQKEEIEQQEAQLEERKSNLKLEEDNYHRQKQLHEEGHISQRELDQAENSLTVARSGYLSSLKSLELLKAGATEAEIEAEESQVQEAEVSLEKAEIEKERSSITAPISGIVAELKAQEGEMVPEEQVAIVTDISEIELTAYVNEVNINDLKEGEKANISFKSIDREFEGVIESISPRTEEGRNSYPVKIIVDNPEHVIKAGMNAQVDLQTARAEDVVLVEQSAVVEEDDKHYVFVVDDSEVEKREIELGLENEELAEINSGLEAEEEVVTLGNDNLSDGNKVNVVNRGDD
ncbi:MAG: efflux RND transporter periplasmic adaptor subunit [Halanaerobium sp.]